MRPVLKGSTDQSIVVRIIDSADGTPETGVVYNTSGIDLWYRREGATKTSITEATLSALNDAHSDGGVLHIGDGYYRIDLPDAAVASGANGVMVGGTVTGMIVVGCYVPLVDFNPYDGVRLGLTAIPNVAQGSTGSIPVSVDTSGRVDVLKINGTSQTARDIGASVLVSSGTGAGQLSVTSGVIQSSVETIQATPLGAIADAVLDEDLSTHTTAGTLGQLQTDTFAGVGAIAGTTLPAIKSQTDKIPASPASTTNITAGTITTVTNLTNAPTNGDLTATMKASVTASVPTATANASAVWNYLTSAAITAGSIGNRLVEFITTLVYSAPPSAAAIADAVTDEAVSDHTTAGTVGANLASIYAAQIDFADDNANTKDEYSVQWFKNGAPVTSGITAPTIQVVSRSDGSDLVAVASMTQIGSTGAYKYDEGTNRITDGEAVVVQVQATIDGSTRTWRKLVSRDASA